LRTFTIVGLLATVAIIAVLTAVNMNAMTAPATNIPSVETPYGNIGGGGAGSVVDTARDIASMDRERVREMQDIINRTDGAVNP
jgi:hypothetical protein